MSMSSNLKMDGRYLPRKMMVAFGCSHELALEYIQAWVDGGYLVMDVADKKDHKKGFRVAQELN
jgi:hypothetical protein